MNALEQKNLDFVRESGYDPDIVDLTIRSLAQRLDDALKNGQTVQKAITVEKAGPAVLMPFSGTARTRSGRWQ